MPCARLTERTRQRRASLLTSRHMNEGALECFEPQAECEAANAAYQAQGPVLVGILGVITVIGIIAILIGGRVVPGILLVASLGTPVLVWASGNGSSWVPRGLIFATPALLFLAFASAAQILDQSRRDGSARLPRRTVG